MDLATVIGLVVAFTLIMMGMLTDLMAFVDYPSMALVFGGGLGAVIVSFPMEHIKRFGKVTRHIWMWKSQSPTVLINQLVEFADLARRDGILALQGVTDQINDPFLVQGINLAVDGTDPEQILETMRTELKYLGQRHTSGKLLYATFGKYTPALGMIGTLVGLVLMLRNLSNPDAIGPAMAIALITTFYGAIAANVIFLPMADKLDRRNEEEMLLKEIIINGVMSIQSGDNPRIVRQKLAIFLAPALRAEVLKEG